MDTSELYIKMCDHPLIQDGWNPKSGDKFQVRSSGLIGMVDFPPRYKSMFIWLPRQDDLQGMYFGTQPHLVPAQWFCFIHDEVCINNDYYDDRFTSAEQVMIAFVMSELHNLKWTGDKWESNPYSPEWMKERRESHDAKKGEAQDDL